jgi:hypothetical protein
VIPDIDVEPEARVGVFLRPGQLTHYARVLGCTSDFAFAQLIGMTERTISRAKNDGIIGIQFVAAVLSTLAKHEAELAAMNLGARFEDIFEVGRQGSGS